PLRVHPDATVVHTGHRWYARLYVEASFCDDQCSCNGIMAAHCGERFATIVGASTRQRDPGRFEITAHTDDHCTSGSEI
ncbi:hypothetical protein Q8G71_37200, partial [Klebsiella pneumoniae]